MYCCVKQCGASFSFILGVFALDFCFASSLHNICSSSGSLFFAHLGGIIFIVHYISIFITDPINCMYIILYTTQLHNNLELQVSTYWCLVLISFLTYIIVLSNHCFGLLFPIYIVEQFYTRFYTVEIAPH